MLSQLHSASGWGVGELRGNRMIGHNGLLPGSTTFIRFFPEAGVGVVLGCNAEVTRDLNKLLNRILELALRTVYFWTTVKP